jgi:very-short-patch-repair endonuclease
MKEFSYEYDPAKRFKQKNNFAKANRVPRRRAEPNKMELQLWKILGPSFTYAGNGTQTIGGKRPDFINEAAKIIVELQGSYWHKNDTLKKTIERINLFRTNGYRTLFIWDHELKNPSRIRQKLNQLL